MKKKNYLIDGNKIFSSKGDNFGLGLSDCFYIIKRKSKIHYIENGELIRVDDFT